MKYFFISLLLSCFSITAQVSFSGKIKNGTEGFYGANIIALPLTKGAAFRYATTNEQGGFSLELSPNASYKLTISYIGYITLKKTISITDKPLVKDFVLQEDPNELKEVVINYKEPIVVKKDTTTYRVKAFTNGKERKLRQVLKKLPGVEVDRAGNVTVKGKKVTTVLVEDKEFFTGDTKLAVNNIPANVIKEVQVIEDYHESDLLKGFEASDKVALNINLKEDKKKFAFGDLEVGGGIKDRYVFHPTLFKYSKKLSYSFIGDVNNTSKKSFTLKDYINYEGGLDIENLQATFNSPITRLLSNTDFYNNKHYFGGFNLQYDVSPNNRWTAFVIGLNDNTDEQEIQRNNYLIDQLQEDRLTKQSNKQSMLLAKLQLKSAPSEDLRIKFANKIELITANNNRNTNSNLLNNSGLNFSNKDEIKAFNLQSNLKMEKKFSRFHTSQAKLDLNFSNTDEAQKWFANDNIFSTQLPVVLDENITVNQIIEHKKYEFKSLLKHFWIVNPKNHLFLSINNNLAISDYTANLNQVLPNNSFQFEDFKANSIDKQLFSSISAKYKYLIGNVFFTTELAYLNYVRNNKQFLETNNYNQLFLIPTFNADWEIDDKRMLKFSYTLKNKFPKFQQLFINNTLHNFNSIHQGNALLKESRYHSFRLYFRKYQNYGWSFYPEIRYQLIKDKIQNRFLQSGIYNTNTPVNIEMPEKELTSSLRITHGYKYWKATTRTSFTNKKYINFNAGNEVLATQNSFSISGGFKSFYIKGPNVDVSLSQHYNDNSNLFFNSISDRTKLDLGLNYEVANWQFNTDVNYSYFKNRITKTKNTLKEVNASIFYQKEDSVWGFELKATNILNNQNKISSSLSDILFYETRTALFPRTIIAKIVYKI